MTVITDAEISSVALASSVSFPAGGTGNPVSVAVICDQKSSGTAGGSSSTSWTTRALNTKLTDVDNIVTISSNQFILGAGTYFITWWAPNFFGARGKCALYDITGTAYLNYGTSGDSSRTGTVSQNVLGSTVHSPSASNTYEIRMIVKDAVADTGFGLAGGSDTGSVVEQYTTVQIIKLK